MAALHEFFVYSRTNRSRYCNIKVYLKNHLLCYSYFVISARHKTTFVIFFISGVSTWVFYVQTEYFNLKHLPVYFHWHKGDYKKKRKKRGWSLPPVSVQITLPLYFRPLMLMSSPIHSWKKNKHTVQLEQKIRILKQMAWGKCQCCHLNNGDIPCLVWMGGLCPKQEAFFNVLGKFQYPVMHRDGNSRRSRNKAP